MTPVNIQFSSWRRDLLFQWCVLKSLSKNFCFTLQKVQWQEEGWMKQKLMCSGPEAVRSPSPESTMRQRRQQERHRGHLRRSSTTNCPESVVFFLFCLFFYQRLQAGSNWRVVILTGSGAKFTVEHPKHVSIKLEFIPGGTTEDTVVLCFGVTCQQLHPVLLCFFTLKMTQIIFSSRWRRWGEIKHLLYQWMSFSPPADVAC